MKVPKLVTEKVFKKHQKMAETQLGIVQAPEVNG